MLLTAMLFAAKAETQARIQRRCVTSGDINLFRSPEYRPPPPDMLRAVNSYVPELAFIEFYDRDDAIKVAEVLRAGCPQMAILGLADNWQHESLLKTPYGYIRVIPSTVSLEQFRQAVMDSLNAVKAPGPDNVIVFLPSKAGAGASTVALNVTGALANKCGKSAILIEADLHSGPAGMYLNINPTHSVVNALEASDRLDTNWNDFITPVDNFSVLPAWNVHAPVPIISPWAYRRLVAYTRQRYEFVIFDLPEVVNPATEVLVTSAKTVYLVCTPEVPSLMLARKRIAALIDRGLAKDKLQVVLNRYSKDGPEPSAVAEILASPITQVIPNDYKTLWEANIKRRLVAENSAVGKAFESFAWALTGRQEPSKAAVRKLLGLFSAA
jgi:pilus assembly protein CpaE